LVLDLNGRLVHVFRNPTADSAEPFGFRYQTRQTVAVSGVVAPLAVPQGLITVADLFP
jgi:hypothetical protein